MVQAGGLLRNLSASLGNHLPIRLHLRNRLPWFFSTNGHRVCAHVKERAQFADTVLPSLQTGATSLNGACFRESGQNARLETTRHGHTQMDTSHVGQWGCRRSDHDKKEGKFIYLPQR